MKVFEGDEWKHAKTELTAQSYSTTRLESQARLDRDYAIGRISLREWSDGTDMLSLVAIPPTGK
jgi:hypothetical protein